MHIATISAKDFVEGKTFKRLRTQVIDDLIKDNKSFKEINSTVKEYNKSHNLKG